MEIYEALQLAVHYLKSDNSTLDSDYQLTANRVEDKWIFWFQPKPKIPGEDVTVIVWPDKKIELLEGF